MKCVGSGTTALELGLIRFDFYKGSSLKYVTELKGWSICERNDGDPFPFPHFFGAFKNNSLSIHVRYFKDHPKYGIRKLKLKNIVTTNYNYIIVQLG